MGRSTGGAETAVSHIWRPYGTPAVCDCPCRDDSKTTEENLGDLQGQFTLADHRPVNEIVLELMKEGYVPSWCTACYRKGEAIVS